MSVGKKSPKKRKQQKKETQQCGLPTVPDRPLMQVGGGLAPLTRSIS